MRMKKHSWFGIGMSGAVAVGAFGLPMGDSASPSCPNFVVLYVDDAEFPAYFDREQLYNLEVDIFEQTNLAKDVCAAEPLERIRTLLQKQMDLVGDR